MARFVHAEYPTRHAGIDRVADGLEALRGFRATHLVLGALALIGSPVTRAAGKVGALVQGWSAARRQRRADAKLWNVALTDARVMADLSRAMDAEAGKVRDVRPYY